MKRNDNFTKAANEYIDSEEFPVIGHPHLALNDFLKGADFATLKACQWIIKYNQNCSKEDVEEMISNFKNFMLYE